MKLTEYNWDTQLNEEIDYPDEPIKAFVDFFRVTKQWRESPEVVYQHWLMFERELTAIRNERPVPPVKPDYVDDGLVATELRVASLTPSEAREAGLL